MKTLIILLLTLSFIMLLFGCSDNVTGPSEIFILSGTIDNWSYGGNIILKAEVYDTTYHQYLVLDSNIISSDGVFSIKLRNVPINLLYSVNFFSDSEYIANVTVNPPNTKSNWCYILTHPIGVAPVGVRLSLYSNDSIPIGFIYRGGTVNISRWFSGFYLYFDKDVIINGTMILNNPPYDDTAFYNLSGKRGWNEVVVQTDSLSNNTYRATISASEPPGGKWRAYIHSSDALYGKSVLKKHLFKLSNSYNNK